MDFTKRMLPTSADFTFSEAGYFVWCGAMLRHKDVYYLIYSRWPYELGFRAWVTHSEICLAKSDSILGKFTFVKRLFDDEYDCGNGVRAVFHNPTVITWRGKYYLYYMMNRGSGDWWDHRNHQRIGVAYTDDPEGEWTRPKEPVIDISEEGIDSLMTSNPTAVEMPDGRILMVYKAVSKYGEMPRGGKVICGAATADSPLGPFTKTGKPLFENPDEPWSVEDPYIWFENGRYYALVKDFHGYFTRTGMSSVALFVSDNGLDWSAAENPLGFARELHYGDRTEPVRNLERPQLYIENGVPKALLCACCERDNSEPTYNIRIPLKADT
ncbi:MAG: sucrase [Ruminococcaceae bacterium]|nr:sucrase [Oscillospiraceae bacterium]